MHLFNKHTFKNLHGVEIDHGIFFSILGYKFLFTGFDKKNDAIGFNPYPELQKIQSSKSDGITWIGHSTFLVQLDGINILTDPIWANNLATTKRSHPPPIPLPKLPKIDAVLISHSHYDHLDLSTIKALNKAWQPIYLVPQGLKSFFTRRGFGGFQVIEKNWWDTFRTKKVDFQFLPAQHWSRRGVFDKNTTHWGGWSIKSSKHTIYFAGDSGYFDGFEKIGQAIPDIDIALMPIGAYGPEWYNKLEHTTPEDAIQGFLDTNAKFMIPMHYGTFRVGEDSGLEAQDRLLNEWENKNLNSERLKLLQIGESLWL